MEKPPLRTFRVTYSDHGVTGLFTVKVRSERAALEFFYAEHPTGTVLEIEVY